MARNWDSISNIFLKISFLSDKSDTYVLMVFVLYNIVALLHTITIFLIPPFVCVVKIYPHTHSISRLYKVKSVKITVFMCSISVIRTRASTCQMNLLSY